MTRMTRMTRYRDQLVLTGLGAIIACALSIKGCEQTSVPTPKPTALTADTVPLSRGWDAYPTDGR